jgi:hypothetical protein
MDYRKNAPGGGIQLQPTKLWKNAVSKRLSKFYFNPTRSLRKY